jgi:hypothetical protein
MALLLHQNVRRFNWVWLPYLINGLFRIIQLAGAGWRALLYGDWAAFVRAFRLRVGRYLYRKPSYSAQES